MRVVVLGGGYAGLVAARELEHRLSDDVDLVVVDETGEHLIQHELHRVIRRPSFAEHISIPLADLLDRAAVRTARVTGLDRDDRTVALAGVENEDGNENGVGHLEYDVAVVALGATTNYYGLPGVEVHATPLKRLAHARTIRRDFQDVASAGGTAVVGGAGLSGVQAAGELAAFAREEDAADDASVVLVEQRDEVAPSFPANFRAAVRDALDALGVDVRTGRTMTRATEEELRFEGTGPLPYDQLVWTGGVRGPDALGGQRPAVRATLALDDRTFVVGDAARIVDADGEAVPATAQAAVRAAPVAAANAETAVRSASGETESGFRPRYEKWRFDSPGWLVSVGDDAVAQLGPQVLTGSVARLVKSGAGLTYLADHGDLQRALTVFRDGFDGESR